MEARLRTDLSNLAAGEGLAASARDQREAGLVYRFAGYSLDAARWELRDAAGRLVAIAPLPFRLLLLLIEQRARAMSKDELLSTLWNGTIVSEGSLTQAIASVRRALGGGESANAFIKSVRGRGYRFAAPVAEELADSPTPPRLEHRAARRDSDVRCVQPRDPSGRAQELARMEPAFESALSGRGAAILISGGTGVGKSWLAGEAASRMVLRGAMRCEARGYDEQGVPPMWPLRQLALALYEEHRAAGDVPDPKHAAELCVLVPEFQAHLTSADAPPLRTPAEQRFFVFSALLALLRRSAQRQPVAIVLEDLHWNDEASLLFLERLAPELCRLPVLLLCTYREARSAALQRVVAALSSDAATLPLSLRGLAGSAVEALFAAHGVEQPPPPLMQRAMLLTQGNPLFVIQLARWLAQQPPSTYDNPEQLQLPDASRAVLRRQVASLPEETRDCLELASALGDDFHLGELQLASSLPSESLVQRLEPAYAAGLLSRDPAQGWRRRFGHPSIRAAIYEGIEEPQRLQLHLKVAEALSRGSTHSSERLNAIAHHYYEAAQLGVTAAAVHHGFQAARAAFAATAYEDAIGHCERILELLRLGTDEPRRCEVELLRGHALRLSGAAAGCVREAFAAAAASARQRTDATQLAEAALAYAGRGPLGFLPLRDIGTVDAGEIELLSAALALEPEQDSPTRARLLSWLAWSLYNSDQQERKVELSNLALAMARRLDDPSSLVECLFIAQSAQRAPTDQPQRILLLREAMARAEAAGLRAIGLDVAEELAWTLFEAGEADAAEREIGRMVRVAESLGRPQDRRKEVRFRAMRLDAAGLFQQAEAALDRVRAETSWPPEHVQNTAIRKFMLHYLTGKSAQTIEQLEAMARSFPLPVAWHCGLVPTYTSVGRMTEAQRALDHLARNDFGAIPNDHNQIGSLYNLARGAADLGDEKACARLREKLAPYAERNIIVGLRGCHYGTVARALGILDLALGQYESALAQLERAIARDEAMGSALHEAWDRLAYAEALLGRNAPDSRARANVQLARAERLLRDMPELPPLRRAAEQLADPAAGGSAETSPRGLQIGPECGH